jgi:hypothetical protein
MQILQTNGAVEAGLLDVLQADDVYCKQVFGSKWTLLSDVAPTFIRATAYSWGKRV